MKIIIFLLTLLKCVSTNSQNLAIGNLRCIYTYKYVKDTNFKSNYILENMALDLSTSESLYYSLDKILNDSVIHKQFTESAESSGGPNVDMSKRKKVTYQQIHINYLEKKMFQYEFLIKNYKIEIPYPKIDWTITNEKKYIDSIEVIKAFATIYGRKYIAWFNPGIPISIGPWKIIGLPGLIFEASDDKNYFTFSLKKLETIGSTNVLLNKPPNLELTTKKDFYTMKEAFAKDPLGAINSSGLGTITKAPEGFKPKKPNNPIELTDN